MTLRYYRAHPGIRNDFHIARNNMTRSWINIFRLLTVSGVRGTCFDIKIRTSFIAIEYSASTCNRFIIFITNDWYFTILKLFGTVDCASLSLAVLDNQ